MYVIMLGQVYKWSVETLLVLWILSIKSSFIQAWLGSVARALVSINEVILRGARLVGLLGWVTVRTAH